MHAIYQLKVPYKTRWCHKLQVSVPVNYGEVVCPIVLTVATCITLYSNMGMGG